MPIAADTGAMVHGGRTYFYDDPAERLPGWPGTNAVLQSRKMNFTLTNLGTTTKVYTGAIKADIVALANFYAYYGATIDIEEGPVYKLTVNLPYDEFAGLDDDPTKFALWEVVPNMAERDIFEVGIYSPTVQGGQISVKRITLNNTIKGAIDQAARNPMMTVNLTPGGPEWGKWTYVAQNYLALRRLKANGVMSFTQTVRRSLMLQVTNNKFYDPISEAAGNAKVSPLVCTNDLIRLYSIPLNIQNHLLPSYAIKKTVTGEDGVDLFALAGYLVKKPTYQQVTPNKIQMTQEFVWDEWLDSLYRPYDGDYTKFPASS